MCSVRITNNPRDCVSLNMLKESAFAEDVEHLPSDALHHVYNFSITDRNFLCVPSDEISRRDRRILNIWGSQAAGLAGHHVFMS